MKNLNYFLRITPTVTALFASIFGPSASADTLENANALFAHVESVYADSLSPSGPETQEIQGYYVRYYANSGIYVGVLGQKVYALGGTLGEDLVYAGRMDEFITVSGVDISDAILSNTRGSCAYYAENTFASALDIQRGVELDATLSITVDGDSCSLAANSIPNHSFNDASASFVDPVTEINATYEIPLDPEFADAPTALSLQLDNGLFLNGVKLDLLAAGCFGVGDGKIGCFDMDTNWRYDPMSPLNNFGTDTHNAHVQPGGQYHYHGNPKALFDLDGDVASPVIGFAADGFPIFGSFVQDGDVPRAVASSYQLKEGARPSTSDSPGGVYDGTFVDDWEFVEGSGDLDECNGMMRDGIYGYYVVDQYPWVLACYQGTPDPSFSKRK